ncbi:YceI family protein [Jonesiaceae bacterium BS-20]|uniref:YceI family protein n=1 Tax=Jonesiaceae bacterium BS-20 TaxID=3120821 RepID=A0AAU7DVF3_9MICO
MSVLTAGLVPATYNVDPTHTTAGFIVRHAGISKVRGSVPVTTGVITVAEPIENSTVAIEMDATGIATGTADRDAHLRSADFFNVEVNPTWTFNSTAVATDGDDLKVTGDLTMNGVTKSITLDVEYTGSAVDPFGLSRAAFEGKIEISRKEFGLTWNAALEAGGLLVSDKVRIEIEVSAVAA